MRRRAAEARPLRVALAGVPNCGKTALFNALTGARQKVANYAGVTVERKEGDGDDAGRSQADDPRPAGHLFAARPQPRRGDHPRRRAGRLAGETRARRASSASPTPRHLRVALRLVLELKEAGRPMVLALNMIDIAARQGLDIDVEGLSRDLGVPIVATVATRRRGIDVLMRPRSRPPPTTAPSPRPPGMSPRAASCARCTARPSG